MTTVAAPPDGDGWCSLSLHVGGSGAELRRAGADPDRLLIVEVSEGFPRTNGLPPEHRHALNLDEIDVLIRSDAKPLALPDPPPTDSDRAIAEHAREFIPDGATLQTGIGSIPSLWSASLRRATAAATASTRRCSRPASCGSTRPARWRTARASSTACR